MPDEATGKFEDFVDLTQENIHRSIVDVCHQLENEGWRIARRADRGLRYWCPATNGCTGCQIWVALTPLVDERLDFYLDRSCFSFKTEG